VPRLVDAILRRVGYELHDTGEPKPAGAPDNLDAPLTGNDSVEGSVGAVALRHSAYTWWAIHRPVGAAARVLTRPLAVLAGSRPAAGRPSPVDTRIRGRRLGNARAERPQRETPQ
jgi:hypothetical protein